MFKELILVIVCAMIVKSVDGQGNYFFDKITTDQGLSNNTVSCITQDHLGRMWFGTYDGLNCYDGTSIKTFRQIAVNKEKSLTDNQIEGIYEDKNNVIWIFQPNGVISSLEDFETSRFRSYRLIPSHIPIEVVTSNRDGSILLKGPQGGFEYLEKEKTFVFRPELKETRIVPVLLKAFKKDNPHLLIQKYWEERQGTCFIATLKSGLIKLMAGTKGSYTFETIRQTSDQPYSLSNNEVYSVFTDRAGIMWLGTKDGGVNRLLPQARFLKTLCYKTGVEHSLPKGTIRAISEDHTGKIWIGTYNDGVAVLNPSTMSYTYINHSGNPANEDWDRVRCIYQTSDKRMWVASYGGLCAIEGKSQKREYFRPGSSSNTLTNGRIYSLAEDKYGFLWIGAWGGVDKLDLRTGKIARVLSRNLSDRHVRKIMFDKEGFLWIGTEFGGINKYNPVSNQLEVIKSSASNTKTLSNNSIYSIYQAKSGLIWIGTSDGLNIYNPITKQIERIGVNNGLPKGLVMGIVEDNDGNIWVSTSKGVARIEPQTRFIRSYDKHDGWLNTEFSEGAYFKSKTGELFFGGIDGITYFNPKEITQNNFLPGISVDILRQKGTFVNFSKADTFKKYCIYIPYKQRNVQIRIQAYHYSNPGRNQIAYKLGSDKSWHYVYSSKAELNINTLKPGTHQLLIKAANADGLWTKPMNIRVRIGFPFWMSTWFWISIVLIGLAGSFIFIRVRLSQERRRNLQLKKLVEERTCEIESQRHQLEIQNKELELIHLQTLKQKEQIVAQHEHLLELHEKLKEVNELKMNFFTNISHEIRTPLTLISGPIENLLLGGEMNSNQMEQLFTVRQQTSYLLSLVNQLLDYRKLESGSAELNMAPGELTSFCKGVCQPFLFEAHSRNITFSFQTEIEILHCMFDGEKVRQIISNLISNALKFTPDEGEIRIEIRLSLPTGQVIVHVEDNGIGIPSDRLGLIFDRFYQVGKSINPHTPGTGIGLSLALELAKVHQGDLTVKSQEGQGSVFSLFLPLVPLKESRAEESSIDSEIQYQSSPFDDISDNQNLKKENQPSILIVDDHPSMLSYIAGILKNEYPIYCAAHVKEAFKILKHQHIDIIISDWLMPEIDGVEFCRRVKGNKQFMHIPFIMVTALVSDQDQLQALLCGADDFITKPFSPQLLRVKIANLLQRGVALRESISLSSKLEPENIREISEDEKLLNKLTRIIEENLSHTEFSPELIGERMGWSRMQLYRRVKQVTGLAPNELIQSMRLKRARQLLENSSFNVSEVGYKVGFNDPKYFSKCFYKAFHILPSQFQDREKQQKEEVLS